LGVTRFRKLTELSGLRGLNLWLCTRITSAGLRHLQRLPHLERLCLDWTGIDDTAVPVLLGMSRLASLSLLGCRISSVSSLLAMPRLTRLAPTGLKFGV
jgi:hypothetical protein